MNNEEKYDCIWCNTKGKSKRGIGTHIGIKHKDKQIEEYVLITKYSGIRPTCQCGCLQFTTWYDLRGVYRNFITGHNNPEDRFSSTNQPYISPESIEKMKKTKARQMKKNGKEIRKKLSIGVRRALETNPEYRENLSKGQRAAWANDAERKEKLSKRNLDRPIQYVSQEEKDFVAHIKKFIKCEIVTQKQIRTKTYGGGVFDVYLPSKNIYIEYDGCYFHGLMKNNKPLTSKQLKAISNDERKNNLVKEIGASLLRIDSSHDWESTRSFRDLKNIAYLII